MKVWLTRKHAERIDGVNLRGYDVGDTLELPPLEARLLLAEDWAKPERRKRTSRTRQRRRASDSR
jgi:hypothetical protein